MSREFTKKQELDAEIRNKLTMPLTVLNSFVAGKKVSRKSVQIAIQELEEILRLMREM